MNNTQASQSNSVLNQLEQIKHTNNAMRTNFAELLGNGYTYMCLTAVTRKQIKADLNASVCAVEKLTNRMNSKVILSRGLFCSLQKSSSFGDQDVFIQQLCHNLQTSSFMYCFVELKSGKQNGS